jgi:vacuolar-type H+-ATPase subunit E/Vma4
VALAQLIAALEHDAATAAERRLTAAHNDATRLRKEARVRADAQVAERLRIREAELRAENERVVVAERRRLRGLALEQQQRLLEEIRTGADGLLAEAARTREGRALILHYIEAARGYLDGLPLVVRGAPDLAPLAAKAFEGHTGVTLQPDSAIQTGVVLASTDGSVRVDATLATQLMLRWPDLSIQVLHWIEHPEDSCAGTT